MNMLTEQELNHIADLVADRVYQRMSKLQPKQLVNRSELAELLSISVRSVDRFRLEGRFEVVPNGRRPLFDVNQCRRAMMQ